MVTGMAMSVHFGSRFSRRVEKPWEMRRTIPMTRAQRDWKEYNIFVLNR